MKKVFGVVTLLLFVWVGSGCAYIKGGPDLASVEKSTKLANITTGDGTYENYIAQGHYTGTEVGIAVGLPGIGKFAEIFPQQSNEELLEKVAQEAAGDGCNAMINVTPHKELYTGLPFVFVGIYVDRAIGTGIKTQSGTK